MKFLLVIRQILTTPRYFGFLCLLLLLMTSCVHRTQRDVDSPTEYSRLGWPKPNIRWTEKDPPVVRAEIPTIPEAEYVRDDELCMTCHETYAKSFAHNVHRKSNCEDCHGPASQHLRTRGKEPGLILNFRKLPAAQSAELCLKCHENDACSPGANWRTSVHANNGLACIDCHRGHYNVPPDTPSTTVEDEIVQATFEKLAAKTIVRGQSPESDESDETKDDRPSLRGTSHNLGAIAPNVCYRCHQDTHQLQTIASPHQIGGKNGFNCTTCHDPHGKLLEYSRKDLCLKCHTGSPTSAWHSSSHNQAGVACVDCHNPHPDSSPQRFVNIEHTQVFRPNRMPMSVNDPAACYKCHTDIYAKNAMPSHHPIKEGKMVCGDCHDPHGQALGNLKEPTLNLVCYKCHAEKQGPFTYEHPPVTENCGICHDPHGTVANNLLKQPATFLCLRCHTGHRTGPNFGPHRSAGLVDVGTSPKLQQAFYSDCTQCHQQIHGSDLPSPHLPHAFFR